MLKNKNITLYITLAILTLFTIGYFVTVNKVSYAFSYDEEVEKYNNVINLINKGANLYASNNKELFKEKDTIYLTVADLLEKGYLIGNEDGKLMNPNSNVKDLNDLKVRITYKDKTIDTKVLD